MSGERGPSEVISLWGDAVVGKWGFISQDPVKHTKASASISAMQFRELGKQGLGWLRSQARAV